MIDHRTKAPYGWMASGSTLFVWTNPEHTAWLAVYDLQNRRGPTRNLNAEMDDAKHIADLLNKEIACLG